MSVNTKNKELCTMYPWLLPYGKDKDTYDYEHTLLDCMPGGWRKEFGEDMCRDMQRAIDSSLNNEMRDEFTVLDIKEKYAQLRIHVAPMTYEISNVIDRYAERSKKVCMDCGARASFVTKGYLVPLCRDCLEKTGGNAKNAFSIEEFYED